MSFESQVQQAAEDHLNACDEAMSEGRSYEKALGPYCGCTTCIVREVLGVTWEMMLEEAQREARKPPQGPPKLRLIDGGRS